MDRRAFLRNTLAAAIGVAAAPLVALALPVPRLFTGQAGTIWGAVIHENPLPDWSEQAYIPKDGDQIDKFYGSIDANDAYFPPIEHAKVRIDAISTWDGVWSMDAWREARRHYYPWLFA